MKVFVIGSGGREHAIAWKLASSAHVEKVYVAPGNGGTALEEKCENIPDLGDISSGEGREKLAALAKALAKQEEAGLVVIGPEAPLAEGLADYLRSQGLAVTGPGKKAARLEASKAFAKSFMEKYGVRSARSRIFTCPDEARRYAADHFGGASAKPASVGAGKPLPLVVKADGLAAGKGVVVAGTLQEADEALASFMQDRTLGDAGATVVLEEFLPGKEVSVLAAVCAGGGKKGIILPFVSARDHKRRFDGGLGANTGGMGAIAPAPDFSAQAREDFRTAILEPTLRGLEEENLEYRGFIFFGLMVHQDRCYLLEYNVRLGDPETQAVLPLMDSDFAELCLAIAQGDLENFPLTWKDGAVCAPVAVAEGYPGPYRKGDPISIDRGTLESQGARLFIAGAKLSGDGLVTAGGRVLSVSAWGATEEEARKRSYAAMEAVSFQGMDYRKDIGREGLS